MVGSTSSPNMDCKMSQSAEHHIEVGRTRCRDKDGFYGTIRYVGPVASASNEAEVYAGIEWDDATRGKHDGSVICKRTNALVKHFACSNGNTEDRTYATTGASFVRMKKLDLGAVLDRQLLESRYVSPDAKLVAPDNVLPDCYANTSSGKQKKPIEFWGEVKLRQRQQLDSLHHVSLRCMGVSFAASDPSIDGRLEYPHLKSIDLAGNLISDWREVIFILTQFPDLEHLSLASNRLFDISDLSSQPDKMKPSFTCILTTINLNECFISSFKSIMHVSQYMPNLQELCVARNDLSDVGNLDEDKIGSFQVKSSDRASHLEQCGKSKMPPFVNHFRNLIFLDCSACKISSWSDQVQRFAELPSLQTLVLNDNPIRSIPMNSNEAPYFTSLQSLQFAGTATEEWSDLEGLACIASLRSFRFRNCPVTSQLGESEVRAIIVARIPQIVHLNASAISSREREEAERRYVRSITKQLLFVSQNIAEENDAKMERDKVLSVHPRYEALADKHKDSAIASHGGAEGPRTLADDTARLTIRSLAASSCTVEPSEKRLPQSLTVKRVKLMCARMFNVDVEHQVLYFQRECDPFPTELDDDESQLSYYGLTNGSEILMDEVSESGYMDKHMQFTS